MDGPHPPWTFFSWRISSSHDLVADQNRSEAEGGWRNPWNSEGSAKPMAVSEIAPHGVTSKSRSFIYSRMMLNNRNEQAMEVIFRYQSTHLYLLGSCEHGISLYLSANVFSLRKDGREATSDAWFLYIMCVLIWLLKTDQNGRCKCTSRNWYTSKMCAANFKWKPHY